MPLGWSSPPKETSELEKKQVGHFRDIIIIWRKKGTFVGRQIVVASPPPQAGHRQLRIVDMSSSAPVFHDSRELGSSIATSDRD